MNRSDVRPAALAGTFYEADAARLGAAVRGYLESGVACERVPRALVAPHAGHVYSGAVAGSAYRALANRRAPVRCVYLLGPAHRVAVRGVASPSHHAFATPLGEVAVDRERLQRISARRDFVAVNDACHEREHSLEVHLPFLQLALPDASVVPLVVGEIHPDRLRPVIDAMLAEDDALVVVSSDLSHFHAYPAARRIDQGTVACMERLAWQEMRPERACGFLPLAALLQSLSGQGEELVAVDVRNSGDTAGSRDRVVGYASLVAGPAKPRFDADTRARLLALARASITGAIDGATARIDERRWPAVCQAPAACFVTLTIDGALRGCIGSLVADRPLLHQVADNAVRAASADPRFPPLAGDELARLRLSISVLSAPEAVPASSQAELLARLRPGVHGLTLSLGEHRATFLPSVWESIPRPEDFVDALRRKASMPTAGWPQDLRAERYTTESFGES